MSVECTWVPEEDASGRVGLLSTTLVSTGEVPEVTVAGFRDMSGSCGTAPSLAGFCATIGGSDMMG